MIDHQELSEFARELSLALNVGEKDYVLDWLLASTTVYDAIVGHWVFQKKAGLEWHFGAYVYLDKDLHTQVMQKAR